LPLPASISFHVSLTTVLTDDEYSLLTYYIAELQAILKVRRTQENTLLVSLNKVSLRNG